MTKQSKISELESLCIAALNFELQDGMHFNILSGDIDHLLPAYDIMDSYIIPCSNSEGYASYIQFDTRAEAENVVKHIHAYVIQISKYKADKTAQILATDDANADDITFDDIPVYSLD